MKPRTLIIRSLRLYWRSHLTVLLATAIAATVLIGALLVGGSVKQSLTHLVLLRLGGTQTAIIAADLLPQASLASRLEERTGQPAAAVLTMPGIVTVPSNDRRANKVQICGVDSAFPSLSPFGNAPVPEAGKAAISASLARHLAVAPGEEIVLRVERRSGMPKDTPLAQTKDAVVPLRLVVDQIVGDAEWARFGLRADHAAPHNAFVNREQLATVLGVPGQTTVILSGSEPTDVVHQLPDLMTGTDASLELRELPDGGWEARSPRVFLPAGVAEAFSLQPRRPTGILTYLANRIEKGERSTPYSFVTGTDASWLPKGLGDDGIVLNQWLADDLQAKVGDRIRLYYYVLGPLRQLEQADAEFTVRHVMPLAGPFADPTLMPDFPGIADSADCTDWDTGVKLDFTQVRPKDEAYWDAHRGTPKAFVSLARAQELWGNRFGTLTAVRFRAAERKDVEHALATAVNPFSIGCTIARAREDGMVASSESTDFGGLFLGLSFFLILAALLLTGLLYSLALDRRREQLVTLRALGWPARQVRRLFLREAMCVALPGIALGALGALVYNHVVIRALTTIWSGSVGSAPLVAHTSWLALLIGGLASLLVAYLALRIPLKRATRGVPREGFGWPAHRKRPRLHALVGAAMVALGLAIVVLTPAGRGKSAAATFFGAGSLLLAGLLTVGASRRRTPASRRFGRAALTQRGASRNPARSLAVEAILASAVFLTVAVGANRHGSQLHAEERNSGTGGFAFFGETTVPVFENLNSPAGREWFGLDEGDLAPLRFVQCSLSPGDETSCLNLNRPQRPRLLGIDPKELDRRKAFQFAKISPEIDAAHPWLALQHTWPDNTVPAITDQTVILWALNRKVGETFTIIAEDGRVVRLRLVAGLANSVLQGSLVIGQHALQDLFPSVSGSRVLLVDAPTEKRAEAGDQLRAALRDTGLELVPCADRLAQFAMVENTYLAIFLALGGLALLLGSGGLGLVLVRNVVDRRAELALFRAVGFGQRDLVLMLFTEHAWLFLRGLLVGAVAGLVAVLPAITTPGSNPALGELSLVLGAVLVNGLLWIWIAAHRALRTPLIPALRGE
jgi:putative ABC transport system permease protein